MYICVLIKERVKKRREKGASSNETLGTRNDGVFIQIVERYFINKTHTHTLSLHNPQKESDPMGYPPTCTDTENNNDGYGCTAGGCVTKEALSR